MKPITPRQAWKKYGDLFDWPKGLKVKMPDGCVLTCGEHKTWTTKKKGKTKEKK